MARREIGREIVEESGSSQSRSWKSAEQRRRSREYKLWAAQYEQRGQKGLVPLEKEGNSAKIILPDP